MCAVFARQRFSSTKSGFVENQSRREDCAFLHVELFNVHLVWSCMSFLGPCVDRVRTWRLILLSESANENHYTIASYW